MKLLTDKPESKPVASKISSRSGYEAFCESLRKSNSVHTTLEGCIVVELLPDKKETNIELTNELSKM